MAPSPKLGKTAFEEDSSAARRARRGVYSVLLALVPRAFAAAWVDPAAWVVPAAWEEAAAWEEVPLVCEATVPLARKACSARSR